LKQAEMKLCAAYLENNTYENNHLIERPVTEPERIIGGSPKFGYQHLQVLTPDGGSTGDALLIRATVTNEGSTGNLPVPLYVDGKIAESQLFPIISKNSREIEFKYQFFTPGKHGVAIGTTEQKMLEITGDTIRLLFSQLSTDATELPAGDSVRVSMVVQSMRHIPSAQNIGLFVDRKNIASKLIQFQADEIKTIGFSLKPEVGTHSVTIGNHPPVTIRVFPVKKVNFSQRELQTFCSTTAKPCTFEYSVGKNSYAITARGTDFLHAEDSYGTIFLPKMAKGNFVAIVKVVELGKEVSDWFRFGLFVRNNLEKTDHSGKELAGSFLVFSTPKRSGTQWDEFGDGSMHNSRSLNYTREHPIPLWLKMVRHGDRLSGYYSFDGKSWILSRESGNLSGIAPILDIGLAAGTNDQKPSTVKFEGFQLWLEN
jgi:regulation of enolase protein 1 (concanavalin A-like superfamily)